VPPPPDQVDGEAEGGEAVNTGPLHHPRRQRVRQHGDHLLHALGEGHPVSLHAVGVDDRVGVAATGGLPDGFGGLVATLGEVEGALHGPVHGAAVPARCR
jgi:hypothetical protein